MHFFALGALLFVLAGPGDDAAGETRRIVVSRGRIQQLATTFARTWQRPPTREELDGLIDDWIRTEVAYRQARALGIDEGDVVVRQRLRQKLEFLTEDATQAAPTNAELADYLAAHPDAFRTPARYTFAQIYLSPERREDPEADARALLARLSDNDERNLGDLGDPLLVPPQMASASGREVASVFGETFANALAGAPLARWTGPIESGYGVHVVRVVHRTEGIVPPLAEVRDAVEREWQNARRIRTLDEAYARMRARYEIVVESIGDAAEPVASKR